MTINEAKRNLRVMEILESRGVRKFGTKWFCPFHDEKNPSFTVKVRPGGDFWKCYGCGKYGDVLDLIAELEQKSISQVLKDMGIEKPNTRAKSPPRGNEAQRIQKAAGPLSRSSTPLSMTAGVIQVMIKIEEGTPA